MIIKKNKKVIFQDQPNKYDFFTDKEQMWYYNGYSKAYGTTYKTESPLLSNEKQAVTKHMMVDLADV